MCPIFVEMSSVQRARRVDGEKRIAVKPKSADKTMSGDLKITRGANILRPSTIRRSAQMRSKPKGQRCGSRALSVPQNPQNKVFRTKWPLLETFQNSVPKEFMTDSRFVFMFHENLPPGSGWNDALFYRQNYLVKCGFWAPFYARLAEGTKSLHTAGSVPRVPCKLLFQSVVICRSYSRKRDLIRIQCMPSAYNK